MNKRYLGLWAALALALVLLCGCSPDAPAGEPSEPAPASEAPADPSPAPTPTPEPSPEPVVFQGTDLEGNAVSSEVFSQSKLTMVNVWATYCDPCLREMPHLGELAGEYDAEEFQIIGVVSDVLEGEDQSLAESLVEQTDAAYPHLLLNESVYYGLLTDVSAVPTTFFVDEDGIVLEVVVGAMDKTAWKEKIDALLEER